MFYHCKEYDYLADQMHRTAGFQIWQNWIEIELKCIPWNACTSYFPRINLEVSTRWFVCLGMAFEIIWGIWKWPLRHVEFGADDHMRVGGWAVAWWWWWWSWWAHTAAVFWHGIEDVSASPWHDWHGGRFPESDLVIQYGMLALEQKEQDFVLKHERKLRDVWEACLFAVC